MDNLTRLFNQVLEPKFDYKVGNLYFAPSYLQAGAIIFLLFLLVLTFARLRRLYVNWSLKGAISMVFLGFFLALIIEGFLIIGGRTFLTEILGWKNPPKPIGRALDLGREKLEDVLGVNDQIPKSMASEKVEYGEIVNSVNNLTDEDYKNLKNLMCGE